MESLGGGRADLKKLLSMFTNSPYWLSFFRFQFCLFFIWFYTDLLHFDLDWPNVIDHTLSFQQVPRFSLVFISDILTNKIALFFQFNGSLSFQKMHVRIIALKSGSVKDDCLPSSLDWWSFSCWVYKLYKTSLRTSAVANLITTKEPLNQQWDCKLSLDW